MAASYPASIRSSFSVKKNGVDVVNDYNVNDLQDEVIAIETALGTLPTLSTTGGTYSSAVTTYASVSSRIANLEAGVSGDVHTQYAKVAGGSTITPSGVGVVGLTMAGVSGGTDTQQWKDNLGNVVFRVDATGTPYLNNSALAVAQDINNLNVLFLFDQL